MSTSVHKPAANPFASYVFQGNDEDEQEEDEEEEELEWSDEEDLHSDDVDDGEFDFYYDDDDEFDDDNDSDTDEGDHEYLDDEKIQYENNYSARPGYFYPEQPYIGPPVVPKPSSEASSSKLKYYVLSPIYDIATIYIKFAILAILIYACALWYTVYYGDLSSITTDMDDDDAADTCPAN